jgi:large-conductance mechanosensitive channel
MIVKFIFLIIAIWLVLRIYQTLQGKKQKKISSAQPQDMVSCETCKIHLPVNEALKNGDKYYCSKDHLPKMD